MILSSASFSKKEKLHGHRKSRRIRADVELEIVDGAPVVHVRRPLVDQMFIFRICF
jgi:hypothetical protein